MITLLKHSIIAMAALGLSVNSFGMLMKHKHHKKKCPIPHHQVHLELTNRALSCVDINNQPLISDMKEKHWKAYVFPKNYDQENNECSLKLPTRYKTFLKIQGTTSDFCDCLKDSNTTDQGLHEVFKKCGVTMAEDDHYDE